MLLEYEWHNISPSYDTMKGLDCGIIFTAESSWKHASATKFPIFVPNDYLFTEYRKTIPNGDKLEKDEVYAHALRDFLANKGGYGLSD